MEQDNNHKGTPFIPLVIDEEKEDIEIDIQNTSLNRSSSYLKEPEGNENDIHILNEMGFERGLILKVYIFLKPRNIENAIELMSEVNGIMMHDFYASPHFNSGKCFICKKDEKFHRNRKGSIINTLSGNLFRNNDLTTPDNNSSGSFDDDDDFKSCISLEDKYEDSDDKCMICYSNLSTKEMSENKNKCGHICCDNCWLLFLKEEIENAKVAAIHCFFYKCQEILTEQFVLGKIQNNSTLIKKYHEFKKKSQILSNKNQKFCPSPNCPGYLERKEGEDKYVSCEKGHKYCFVCLKPWHGTSKCDEEVDKDFQLWKKGKVIKQCPNCKFWTEKNKGCNHMTCAECKYQWCWLCEGKYTTDHFGKGQCNGMQFALRNYLPGQGQKVTKRCCCCEITVIDDGSPLMEDCLTSDPTRFCRNQNDFVNVLYFIGLIFFGSVPLITVVFYLSFCEDKRFNWCKGFINLLSVLLGCVSFIYFQFQVTCLIIVYTILSVVYPPFNTISIIKELKNGTF